MLHRKTLAAVLSTVQSGANIPLCLRTRFPWSPVFVCVCVWNSYIKNGCSAALWKVCLGALSCSSGSIYWMCPDLSLVLCLPLGQCHVREILRAVGGMVAQWYWGPVIWIYGSLSGCVLVLVWCVMCLRVRDRLRLINLKDWRTGGRLQWLFSDLGPCEALATSTLPHRSVKVIF